MSPGSISFLITKKKRIALSFIDNAGHDHAWFGVFDRDRLENENISRGLRIWHWSRRASNAVIGPGGVDATAYVSVAARFWQIPLHFVVSGKVESTVFQSTEGANIMT